MNYIPQVAKMLGVEIGEAFRIEGSCEDDYYCFSENGLIVDGRNDWQKGTILTDLICGNKKIVKIPFEPKEGEKYFTVIWFSEVANKLVIASRTWYGDSIDFLMKYAGNVFRTEAEAEAHKYEIYEKLTRKKWKGKE